MSTRPMTAIRKVLTDAQPLPAGPASMESDRLTETRRKLAVQDVATMPREQLVGAAAQGLSEMMEALQADRKIVTLKDKDEMVALMAEDDDTDLDTARHKLFGNGQDARAFTAEKTGIIYFLDCPERPHDTVHESVHVMSAPGGTTRIKAEFGDPLNEGFTEMFTIEICNKLGVPLAPAYKDEVAFVTRLGEAVGLPMLHAAYMQNAGMEAILAKLALRWQERSEGFGKKFSTKKFVVPTDDKAELRRLLVERLVGGAFKQGEARQFWTALLQ